MAKYKVLGNVSKFKEVAIAGYSFKIKRDDNGFDLPTKSAIEKRIGNLSMNEIFLSFTQNKSKVRSITLVEIEKYMANKFALVGIANFSLKIIMPLPEKALEMTVNEYVDRIITNKKRKELERTTYVPSELGNNAEIINIKKAA